MHNVWVAGDTLYMGAYNAGFRAFDISGELRGDLRAQEREMAHVNTGDMNGNVPNAAITWGVVVRDGLAYVNDITTACGSFASSRRPDRSCREVHASRARSPARRWRCWPRSRRTAARSRQRVRQRDVPRLRRVRGGATVIALVRFGPRGAKRRARARRRARRRREPAGPARRRASRPTASTTTSRPRTACRIGYLWKFSTAADSLEGNVTLGNFPATLQVSPDGYVRLRRELQPARRDGAVERVRRRDGDEMAEVARIQTCTMPHGSRLNARRHEALLGVHDG